MEELATTPDEQAGQLLPPALPNASKATPKHHFVLSVHVSKLIPAADPLIEGRAASGMQCGADFPNTVLRNLDCHRAGSPCWLCTHGWHVRR